jgi:ribosomal protein S9
MRGKPMGVRIEGGGCTTYGAARLAGSRALTEFLEQLELENFRID